MPELSRFFGIVVKMVFFDDEQHHKPHVHVYYGDYEASMGIDGELLAGSLPVKQKKLIDAWLILHESELYEAWNNAMSGKPIPKIAPLS